jgi:flagella basal body P-ring formation protein FlgA
LSNQGKIVQQITKKYEDANFKVHLAGSALFTGVIKQAIKATSNTGT